MKIKRKIVLISVIASALTGILCIIGTREYFNQYNSSDNLDCKMFYGSYQIGGSPDDTEYITIIPPLADEDPNLGEYYRYNNSK